MLTQGTELRPMRAEAARAIDATTPRDRPADRHSAEASTTQPAAQKIFFDATLVLHHGLQSAVGIVRVEHYLAEYLALDPAVALDFVIFDRNHNHYRSITAAERRHLEQILFRRYSPGILNSPVEAEPEQAASTEMGIEATAPESGAYSPRLSGVVVFRHWSWLPWNSTFLRRNCSRLRRAAVLPAAEFEVVLSRRAMRLLPIRAEHTVARRVATRLLRTVTLAAGRGLYRVLVAAAALKHRVTGFSGRLAAPDLEISSWQQPKRDNDSSPFQTGDVLISAGNTWDYMDYRYLARTIRQVGIRFISVVYDVAAMELPFVTPSPAHLYHRHWVEIGHVSERLIAISRFTAESYDRFISKPNGIDVSVDYAPLPNFLRERAAEIGETMMQSLEGRKFILYCSTIEVRKNHILLLHLWEELRQRVSPEQLPILIFVGKWGWSTEAVRLVVDGNWRLRSHLRVMTNVSDAELIWLYRHARVTVFPSLTEGFGLAAAESLSFGTPVIISNCPALQEATEQLMPAFHPHDFMGWLRELERLILDDSYLDTLREAAARFRGPAYDAFAAQIRDAALAPPAAIRLQADTVPGWETEA
jgi:glycosyltransferase involved in cell wall biosynthesis